LASSSPDLLFDTETVFAKWLQELEKVRRNARNSRPSVYLQDPELNFGEVTNLENQFADEMHSDGTLVVAENGALEGDIEVTSALIDGLFKGRINAADEVVLENHALVIGEINTRVLTIRGGAIVEGSCYFKETTRMEWWERSPLRALKTGFAKVLGSRQVQ